MADALFVLFPISKQAQKNNHLRFSILVEVLSNAKDDAELPLAIGVAVFLNTIIAKAVVFEERVSLRGEMVESGMMDAVDNARSRFKMAAVSGNDTTQGSS